MTPWQLDPWIRCATALVAAMRRADVQDLKQHELLRRGACSLHEAWHGKRVTGRHPDAPWRAEGWMSVAQIAIDALCQAETDGHDVAEGVARALWNEVNRRLVGGPTAARSR